MTDSCRLLRMKSKDHAIKVLRKVVWKLGKKKKTVEIIRECQRSGKQNKNSSELTTLVQKSVEKETFQAFLLVFPVTYDHIFYHKIVFNDQNR